MARRRRSRVRAAAGGGAGRNLEGRGRDFRALQRPAALRRRDSDRRDVWLPRLTMSSNNATRAALAVASGLAMGLAFPKFDYGLLAWVALVPLFYVIEGESMRRVFGWAYLQGFASYLVSLYWIPIPLHDFAGVRMSFAIVPMLLLAGIVAINTAVAIWAGEFVARRTRIPAVLTMPVAWTAVEWIRTYVPAGFPWNLLGYAAYRNLELIQFAEFTGVYGVSALIVFFNAVVYVVIFRRGGYRLQTVSLSALTAAMIALVGFGAWRIDNLKNAPSAGSFKVAMVQGNIPQSLKWDPKFLPESYKVYQDVTASAAKRRGSCSSLTINTPPSLQTTRRIAPRCSRSRAISASRCCSEHQLWHARTGAWDFTIARTWCRPRAKWMRITTRSSWCHSASMFRLARSSATSSIASWRASATWFPAKSRHCSMSKARDSEF